MLKGKKIVLGITGSIAAYKSCLIIRGLVKRGAEVQVVITPAGKEFITPVTLSALTHKPVISDFFAQRDGTWHSHVDLGLWADAMLIAPCTASSLGKMANAVADNMLITTYLSMKAPVFIAPAMDLDMYRHPATQRNIETLRGYGNHIIEPGSGFLASGLEGKGRMEEPENIIAALDEYFENETENSEANAHSEAANGDGQAPAAHSLAGKHACSSPPDLPTRKSTPCASSATTPPARWASPSPRNACNAELTSPSSPALWPCSAHRPSTASTWRAATRCTTPPPKPFRIATLAILCAAVADFKPAVVADQKIKRGKDGLHIDLLPTQDIAAALGKMKTSRQKLVAFALETNNEVHNAEEKLRKKNADLIVLNSTRIPDTTFGSDNNQIAIISRDGRRRDFPKKSKQRWPRTS
jgi:phosphopantothenoylcysteine decarboxylase/phosphopantothenate--cysteine ligase